MTQHLQTSHRREFRHRHASEASDQAYLGGQWANIDRNRTIFSLEHAAGNAATLARRYGTNSRPANPNRIAQTVRGPWPIDEPLHRCLKNRFKGHQSLLPIDVAANDPVVGGQVMMNGLGPRKSPSLSAASTDQHETSASNNHVSKVVLHRHMQFLWNLQERVD